MYIVSVCRFCAVVVLWNTEGSYCANTNDISVVFTVTDVPALDTDGSICAMGIEISVVDAVTDVLVFVLTDIVLCNNDKETFVGYTTMS